MKRPIILAWIFLLVSAGFCELVAQQQTLNNAISPEMLQLLEEMMKISGLGTAQNISDIKETLAEFKECTANATQKQSMSGANPLQDIHKFCEVMEDNKDMYACIDKMAIKLKLQVAPDFATQVYSRTFKEFCTGDNEKTINEVQKILDCIVKNAPELRAKVFTRCIPMLSLMKTLQMATNCNAAGACVSPGEAFFSDIQLIKVCLTEALNETCQQDYTKTIEGLLKPFENIGK